MSISMQNTDYLRNVKMIEKSYVCKGFVSEDVI